jgi:HSP20 family protein
MSRDPLEKMQREVERMFRDLVYHRHQAGHFADPLWAPPTDLMVSQDRACVVLEIAGVPRDSVRVRLRGSILEISGRRHPYSGLEGSHYHRAEIYFGDFQRVIELPWEADPASVSAQYHDGMLEIRLSAVRAPRQLDVPVQGKER